MARTVTKNRLVTAWTSFISTFAFFFLIGFFLLYDEQTLIPWWCWLIIAFPAVEAIRTTIQYIAGENKRVCPNCHQKTNVDNQFCHNCGYDLRSVSYENYEKVETADDEIETQKSSRKSYCNTCGGPLDGNEIFCPTCGAPLRSDL
jgi:RNA polymerase subunit RPABC4/transcription elongation factor Spt4